MTSFTESIVEEAALAVLGRLDWTVLHGPEIAVGALAAERSDPGYRDVILERRLRAAYEEVIAALSGSPVLGLIQRHLREVKADTVRLSALYEAFKRRDAEE